MQKAPGTKKQIRKDNDIMGYVPVQARTYRMEENGVVSILIPKFTGWLSSKLLQPYVRHPYIALALDELGTATWLSCDGKHTVKDICQAVEERFGPHVHPAKERITTFLWQLYKDKLIYFID